MKRSVTSQPTPSSPGMLQQLRPALLVCLLLTVLTGLIYPAVVWGLAQLLFPYQANGSLVDKSGQPTNDLKQAAGSALIGQSFDQPQYFWPRPSATTPVPYTSFNADKGTGSSGSNLSPTNPDFVKAVQGRVDALHQADPANTTPIPVDLITTSASGLDPHESLAAVEYQAPRIARLRKADLAQLQTLIAAHTQEPTLGVLGQKVVNVLTLNLDLDRAFPYTAPATAPATAAADTR